MKHHFFSVERTEFPITTVTILVGLESDVEVKSISTISSTAAYIIVFYLQLYALMEIFEYVLKTAMKTALFLLTSNI